MRCFCHSKRDDKTVLQEPKFSHIFTCYGPSIHSHDKNLDKKASGLLKEKQGGKTILSSSLASQNGLG